MFPRRHTASFQRQYDVLSTLKRRRVYLMGYSFKWNFIPLLHNHIYITAGILLHPHVYIFARKPADHECLLEQHTTFFSDNNNTGVLKHLWAISNFIPPENTKKLSVFWCLEGVKDGNIGQKWVKGPVDHHRDFSRK